MNILHKRSLSQFINDYPLGGNICSVMIIVFEHWNCFLLGNKSALLNGLKITSDWANFFLSTAYVTSRQKLLN